MTTTITRSKRRGKRWKLEAKRLHFFAKEMLQNVYTFCSGNVAKLYTFCSGNVAKLYTFCSGNVAKLYTFLHFFLLWKYCKTFTLFALEMLQIVYTFCSGNVAKRLHFFALFSLEMLQNVYTFLLWKCCKTFTLFALKSGVSHKETMFSQTLGNPVRQTHKTVFSQNFSCLSRDLSGNTRAKYEKPHGSWNK